MTDRLNHFLTRLWLNYTSINPQAEAIHALLEGRGEKVINDHVAFRTFALPKVSIDVFAKTFTDLGYVEKGKYHFPVKKLFAKHYEHPTSDLPKVFISELKVSEFSKELQEVVTRLTDQIPEVVTKSSDLPVTGVAWKPVSFETYEKLLKESEYAAWMSAFGFRVNHFTVFFNALKTFQTLPELNTFLKDNGFKLNASGGEVKGTPEEFLEQSSTLAALIDVEFSGQKKSVPGCYYEFARRYPGLDGALYRGFVASSADKLFESTDTQFQ